MLIYSMSVSVDGFIADRDGEFGWGVVSDEQFRFHLEQVRPGRAAGQDLPPRAADRQRRDADIVVRFAPIAERGETSDDPLSVQLLLRHEAIDARRIGLVGYSLGAFLGVCLTHGIGGLSLVAHHAGEPGRGAGRAEHTRARVLLRPGPDAPRVVGRRGGGCAGRPGPGRFGPHPPWWSAVPTTLSMWIAR